MTDRAAECIQAWEQLPPEAVRDGCAVLAAFLAGRHGDVLELMSAAAEEGRAGNVTLAALLTAGSAIPQEDAPVLQAIAGDAARAYAARTAFGADPPGST